MILAQLINGGLTRIQNSLAQGESILGISSALVSTFTTTLLKSDSREKSSNILISQQDLKNQFLSFFCPQIALRQIRNLIKIVPAVGLLFVRTITSVFDVGVADCPNFKHEIRGIGTSSFLAFANEAAWRNLDTFYGQKHYFSVTRRYVQGNSEARRSEIIQ